MADTPTNPPLWLDPTHPDLKGAPAREAVKDLIIPTYPKVIRSQTDLPVTQQQCGLVSWQLFKEPKKLTNGSIVYGFFKLRGNYSDANQCKNRAADIIRTQDSKNKIRLAPVGAWLPITDSDDVSKETVNVSDDTDGMTAAKELAAKETEGEQARIMKEVRDRAEEVTTSKDYNDDPDHINYYTMKRVGWLRMIEHRDQERKKLEELEKKISISRKLLHSLETKHPTFATDWIDNYNIERRRVKIPDYTPSVVEDEEYKKFTD